MSSYDPARPWESVMREATSNVEHWLRELQEPAFLYACSARAEVAPSWVSQQHEYSPGITGKRNATKLLALADGAVIDANRKFGQICHNYNLGKCNFDRCRRLHVCEKCREPGHTAATCQKADGKASGPGKKGQGKQWWQEKDDKKK